VKLVIASLLLLLTPALTAAQAPVPSADALRERLSRVENQRGHEVAEDALAHARRALGGAIRAAAAGQTVESRRALAIAESAIVLADRLTARERARRALAEARERKRAAHRRAAAAREALERSVERRDAEADG